MPPSPPCRAVLPPQRCCQRPPACAPMRVGGAMQHHQVSHQPPSMRLLTGSGRLVAASGGSAVGPEPCGWPQPSHEPSLTSKPGRAPVVACGPSSGFRGSGLGLGAAGWLAHSMRRSLAAHRSQEAPACSAPSAKLRWKAPCWPTPPPACCTSSCWVSNPAGQSTPQWWAGARTTYRLGHTRANPRKPAQTRANSRNPCKPAQTRTNPLKPSREQHRRLSAGRPAAATAPAQPELHALARGDAPQHRWRLWLRDE